MVEQGRATDTCQQSLQEAQHNLAKYLHEVEQKLKVAVGIKWNLQGKCMNKYFFFLLKQKSLATFIPSLLSATWSIVSSPDQLTAVQKLFF